jgi:hypothetical protein
MCIGTLDNHSINLSKYINNIYNNNKIKRNIKLFFSLSNDYQTIKSTDMGTLQKINNNNVCMQWKVPIARHSKPHCTFNSTVIILQHKEEGILRICS